MIRFGSVCSGIEAASVAWNPLGWKAAWLAEIEPFPCAVLAHHYPDVTNLGAMNHADSHANAGGQVAVAFQGAGSSLTVGDISGTLRTAGHSATGAAPMAMQSMQVRRLTPRECERLQGYPDDYTLIPSTSPLSRVRRAKLDMDFVKYLARGGRLSFEECMNAAADGPRYKAIGNSWAVPVVAWLGARIDRALAALAQRAAA